MEIYFHTKYEYDALHDALIDAFAAGMTFGQSGQPVYDEDGEETEAYMDAFNSIHFIEPVFPPEEYMRQHEKKLKDLKELPEVLAKAGCTVTEEELADLKEVFEDDLRIARERWDRYCKRIKKRPE